MRFIILILLTILPFILLAAEPKNEPSSIRLELSRAKLYLKTSRQKEAVELLSKLENKYFGNYKILLNRATTEIEIGRIPNAVRYLKKAQKLAPNDQSVINLAKHLATQVNPYISANHEFEKRGENTIERFFRLSAVKPLSFSKRISANIDYNNYEITGLVSPVGNLRNYFGSKTKGTFSFENDFSNSDKLKTSIFASADVIGGGAEYSFWDFQGHTDLFVEYNRPEWSFLETLVDKGTSDRIGISRLHKITSNFYINAEIYLKRYNLSDKDNLANSSNLKIFASYRLSDFNPMVASLGNGGGIRVDYNLDGEYASSVKTRISPLGAIFSPIPLTTREVHMLSFSVEKEIGKLVTAEVYLGRLFDRFGDDAPVFGGEISYKLNKHLDINFYGSRAVSTDNSSEKAERIGVTLKHRW